MTRPSSLASAVVELLKASADGPFQPWSMWLEGAKLLSRLAGHVDSDGLTQLVLRECEPKTWPSLVSHIDFDADEPDLVLTALLGRSKDSDLRGRAAFRFIHPHSVSSGPDSANLRGRRAAALRWRQRSYNAYLEWLGQLIDSLDADIARAEQRKAEDPW